MENLEITAKTVEEARKQALARLNVGPDEVEITVLNEGKSGILGMGGEDARISVRLRKPENGGDEAEIQEAKQILTDLVEKMGIQASINVEHPEAISEEEEPNPVTLNIVGGDLGILIGHRGQTLDALQYITRLIFSRKSRSRLPVTVDVEGYKQRRYDDLRTLALNVAAQVKTRKTSIRLEPMTAFERRIVHLALANDPDVTTESMGEGEARKVVVMPASRK